MADFDVAVEVVLEHEGGKGTLPGDPGGPTAFGWSQAACEAWGIAQPATAAEAAALYQKYFWNPLYNQIASQEVGTKILDDCVNQGTPEGSKHLQEALVRCGRMVAVDGIFGPATLTAVNQAPEELLLGYFRLIQYQSYAAWIAENPAREALRVGLARRAAWPDDAEGTIAAALLAGTYQPTVNE
jgi:lysozyme family protein